MGPSERADRSDGIASPFGVVADKRTYKNLGYLLLAIPLGIAYYTLVFLGLGLGTILLLALVGAPLVIGTILGARLLAALERALANALLDLDLEAPADVPAATDASGGGLAAALRGYLEAASTWRGLGFLLLKVWIGVVALVLLFLLATAVSLLASPLRYPHEVEFGTVNDRPITWLIDTGPELALAVALGNALGLAVLHLANGVAYVAGRIAVALLDGPGARDAHDAHDAAADPDPDSRTDG